MYKELGNKVSEPAKSIPVSRIPEFLPLMRASFLSQTPAGGGRDWPGRGCLSAVRLRKLAYIKDNFI
jgi:hypothetical protein